MVSRSASNKSKSQKKSKVQKLASGLKEAQKGMIEMATELWELCGLPAAIKKTFDVQLSKHERSRSSTRTSVDTFARRERELL